MLSLVETQAIKTKLDIELKSVDDKVVLFFGIDLMSSFRQQGWIDVKAFGLLGTSFLASDHLAYGTHMVFPSLLIADDTYSVGKE